jgi:inositol-pentakisphosphate 2-kinase
MHSHLRKVPQKSYCPLDLYSNNPTRVKNALHVLLTDPTLKKTLKIEGDLSNAEEVLLHVLIKDPVLTRLKTLQMHLDELDIEKIYPLYQKTKSLITNDIEVWKRVVSNFNSRPKLCFDVNTEAEQTQRIYEYVLSMTFKDCSLMINAVKTHEPNKDTITLKDGSVYRYDIKVIDTDLKSIDKIPYWYELDQSIIQNTIITQFVNDKCCKS